MNFKKALFLSLTILLALTSYAQITTKEIEVKKKPVEEAPKVYDGFSNFEFQQRDVDYKQYIGQQVYFPDFIQELNYSRKQKAYFTITDIAFGDAQRSFEKGLGLSNYPDGGLGIGGPLLILKQEGSTAVNFYSLRHGLKNFVLVSYFLKQKQLHEGKSYVIVNSSGNFIDAATKENVSYSQPLYGGIWKCEVNMVKTEPELMEIQVLVDNGGTRGKYLYPNQVYIAPEHMLYILKDSLGHVITISDDRNFVKNIEDDVYYRSNNETTCFMRLDDYKAETNRVKKEAAQAAIERNREKEIAFAKDRDSTIIENVKKQKQLNDLKKKFGNENGTLIFKGKVKIGMTKQMCIAALGTPFNFKITKTKSLNKEVYYYGIDLIHEILYFENDYLVKISNTMNLN